MKSLSVAEILELPVAERIRLRERIVRGKWRTG